jgi:pimeloyl-ACP methyl ester carboxylesterase
VLGIAGAIEPAAAASGDSSAIPVPCKDLQTFRALGSNLSSVTNPRNGDVINYIVIGDAAKSNELLVMFNGTGTILPDWPTQLLTNSTYSPKIAATDAYIPSEDGPISLCHDYRIVLFDYPGVGNASLPSALTFDRISNDVDAMLGDAGTRYGISTHQVNLVGWSLGTLAALKYALLSPAARPERKIKNAVLIATRPGGNLDGKTSNNQAPCVSTLFDALLTESLWTNNPTFKDKIDITESELTFPFLNQPANNGVSSGCASSIDATTGTIDLSVTLNCPAGGVCSNSILDEAVNRLTSPWSETGGIDYGLYVQQRQQANDWSFGYCPTADNQFNSTLCEFAPSQSPEMSKTNGGICQTMSSQPDHPVSRQCAALQISGRITVLNGPEDLFIQWTYGRALVEAYRRDFGADKAAIVTYAGSDGAGHAVLIQHPLWT